MHRTTARRIAVVRSSGIGRTDCSNALGNFLTFTPHVPKPDKALGPRIEFLVRFRCLVDLDVVADDHFHDFMTGDGSWG